jgi:4-coumarate--CoA ligase
MSAPRCGAKVFIMAKFSVLQYLQYLDIYRITFMTTVPTILNSMVKYEHSERFNLKAVEVVTSGSAPLDSQLAAAAAQNYLRAGVRVKQGWGMTETTCSVCGFSPDDDDDGRSIGWLNPNCAAKIVPVDAEDGDPISSADKTTGEIWVAGPQMMKGYWQKPDVTRETVVEEDGYRWIRTGDIGYIDQRGCVYIVDRLKVGRFPRPQSTPYANPRTGIDQSQRSPSCARRAAARPPRPPGHHRRRRRGREDVSLSRLIPFRNLFHR